MHRRMRTSEPGRPVPPAPGAGDTRYMVVDMMGKELRNNRDEKDKPYSLYARLTGLPLVEVKLPGEVSAFMLARTFNYQGEPWRFDLFGGSRLSRGGGCVRSISWQTTQPRPRCCRRYVMPTRPRAAI
ncbi:hypothetical protein ACEQUB_p00202 (plasmid) [Ralstonia syzygii]